LGEGRVPVRGRKSADSIQPTAATRTLVIRLAEKASEFADRDATPALADWAGGYVTLRGAWCEPLDDKIARALNHRLAEAKRSSRGPVDRPPTRGEPSGK
jgi:hypothetical protein